ncbi:SDR family oxidoreductase [Phyllobacterium myrsinacearum]|uniref:Short-chain dehydrogenase/reductase n=1 Tax=Phyllobacterium myrsinacearum TaxID=28101 RepID=A0A2S9JAS1_9HYPH|nr:SDR family oxidoreductase [Phyllobacterium myrsinacearum]PRD49864.1 short-chain dehydrogenase/reductase [Phyllobacterium myrsinacearum]PWV83910.1 NADP-dependent 3-hydroxy acid dehydrogenase YdfG [Phyllobacterium myrsinacearum]RZU97021.1 NADP-dependent 3-hydroxy acid dehydrogenase YdfG [Phyllobacterium myrsinacearum]
MNTILITGSSSGFGLETARYFLDRDWTVIATMRKPRKDVLPASERLRIVALDVTEAASISRALNEAGPIDALVNNAGAGLMGALEGVSMEAMRQLFELNTFGTMAMTQAALPGFRKQGSGVIVNVSSAVTLKPLPLLSAYTASKAAVETFSENLALEVELFGVRVRLVIPGRAPKTSFSATARDRSQNGIPEAYASWAKQVFSATPPQPAEITTADDVAKAVWQAVTDASSPFRILAGADAVKLAAQVA